MGIVPDNLDVEIPATDLLDLVIPKDFDLTAELVHVKNKRLPDGCLYTGTMLNGLPHGFGRIKFAPNYNKHPDISEYENLNFIFYEGNMVYGHLHGIGMLLLDRGELFIGQFRKD
mmetsp:Transcript_18097/g.13048  ORF Transcript_18097/g.13048 Transcript_18097/m.13048 type:complete len:115 (-) Transcript_18097:1360-1704(-)